MVLLLSAGVSDRRLYMSWLLVIARGYVVVRYHLRRVLD